METPINKDIDKYKSDFFKGLSFRETIWCGIAFILAIGISSLLVFKYKWNVLMSVYVAFPGSFILAVNGFYSKNGMTFFEKIQKKKKVRKQRPLVLRCEDPRKHKIENLLIERKGNEKWQEHNLSNTKE